MTTHAIYVEPQAGRDGRPVPRWATIAAHLAVLTTLPSGLWRVGLAAGLSLGLIYEGAPVHVQGWEAVYVVGLSVVAEGAALLTLALVRPWGERVPAWISLLGGRRVPPWVVVVPAAIGALLLQAIWTYAFRDFLSIEMLEFSDPGWRVLLLACYLPLLAWAPLLAAVTFGYWRRRCR